MFIEEYEEQKYNNTFSNIYNSLKKQKENDPKFTIYEMRKLLRDLYINQENDWDGGGGGREIVTAATIAACEALFHEWKEEEGIE